MIDRRNFLKVAGAVVATAAVEGCKPSSKPAVAASVRRIAGANGKVDVALIGIGHRGLENAKLVAETALANVVAVCDVNLGAPHTLEAMAMFPDAKRYKDFRRMFDDMHSSIEAVFVSTPDFSHFPICMRAIKEGIHVYCEKPLCRTFHENQLLIDAARKYPGVVTQMGNQGHSGEQYYQFQDWMKAGLIKDVTRIVAHMNNDRRWHVLDPAITRFPDAEPVPSTMDWDVWQSQTMYHDYSHWLDEGNWRCWYDFGMGALGDWGAHIFDTCHEFLKLGLPDEVSMKYVEGHNDYFFPMSSTIEFKFPRRGSMPACTMTWYDGINNLPELPEGYGESAVGDVPMVNGGELKRVKVNPGKEIYARDFIFKGASHSSPLSIVPSDLQKQMEAEHRIPDPVPADSPIRRPWSHHTNFLEACMGKGDAHSPFEIAGELAQVQNLGVIAQRLNTGFKFDRSSKEIMDNPFANALLTGIPPRKGWEDYYVL